MTPRVTKATLPAFVGRLVSLVGKTVAVAGPSLTLQAADLQNVTVNMGGVALPQT